MSIALICGLAAVAAFAGWRGARPPNPMKGPRLMPWRVIMVAAATAALLLLATVEQQVGFGPH